MILKSGSRTGQLCGRRATGSVTTADGQVTACCSMHRKQHTQQQRQRQANLLCSFHNASDGSGGVILTQLLTEERAARAIAEHHGDMEHVAALNGYINVRVGWPVLRDESVPLALFPEGWQTQNVSFTPALLAHHLAKSVAYILSRPDVYALAPGAALDSLALDRIVYDDYMGMYIAQLSLRS